MNERDMRMVMEEVKRKIGREVEASEGDPPPWMIDKLILEMVNEMSRVGKGD